MTQFQIDKAFLLIKEGFEVLATIQSELDLIVLYEIASII